MNILIVRIGRMGDMVMILPALREILRRYPNATLYAITSKDGLRLLPLVGIVKEHIFVYRNGVIFRAVDNYKAKQFIDSIDFAHIFSFRNKKAQNTWLPKNAHLLQPLPQIQHYSTRCIQLVSPAAAPNLFQRHEPYYVPKAHHQTYIDNVFKNLGILNTTTVIGFHPTYSGFNKWGRYQEKIHRLWPSAYFSHLASDLMKEAHKQQLDLKIVMNVLPSERHLALQILEQSGDDIVLLPDFPDFETYLAYLRRLNTLVVSNTGVMHLAAMLATPIVALFSNLHPEDCGPYMDPRFCRVLRAEEMPDATKGLAAISSHHVLQEVLTLVRDNP